MRRALPIALLSLCAAIVLSQAHASHRNTLYRNGAWVSSKVGLARGVMGAVAFLTTRPPLSRNRLDLGTYFGFQEVTYREALDLEEISFDLQLSDGASLTLLYSGDETGFDGLRLSRAAGAPSAALRIDPDGGFLTRKPFAAPSLDGWRHIRARFNPTNVAFTIDGAPLTSVGPIPSRQARFGFHGSLAPALVDNVELTTRSGRRIVEPFSNRRDQLGAIALALALVITLNGVVLAIARSTRAADSSTWMIVVNSTLLAGAIAFYAVDFYLLAARYPPVEKIDWQGFPNNIESESDVVARLDKRYPRAAAQGVIRILFIGSSQTWGAGAVRMEDVFAARVERRLNREAGGKFEVINCGISGSTSTALLGLYQRDWIRFSPKAVVIDLGTNDADTIAYRANLKAFVAFNSKLGIRTLFVLEANAAEHGGVGQHAVMRDVAREESVPTVDLHGWLEQRRDRGFLFWDFAHLTSFGQLLTADALFPAIVDLLK